MTLRSELNTIRFDESKVRYFSTLNSTASNATIQVEATLACLLNETQLSNANDTVEVQFHWNYSIHFFIIEGC